MTAPEIEGYIIRNIMNYYNPNMIFVDAGYGLDIVDHIRELGYKKIKAVFFNGKPNNPDKYVNRRSEMHDICRNWFYQEGGVDIRDSDEVCNEYSVIPDLKINSQGKLFMIAKDEIKELNQGRSPDFMDSLILTFAENVAKQEQAENLQKEISIERKKKNK